MPWGSAADPRGRTVSTSASARAAWPCLACVDLFGRWVRQGPFRRAIGRCALPESILTIGAGAARVSLRTWQPSTLRESRNHDGEPVRTCDGATERRTRTERLASGSPAAAAGLRVWPAEPQRIGDLRACGEPVNRREAPNVMLNPTWPNGRLRVPRSPASRRASPAQDQGTPNTCPRRAHGGTVVPATEVYALGR